MKTLLLYFVAFAVQAYAGTPTPTPTPVVMPTPTGTPLPMPTPAINPPVPVEISLAALTADNQLVIDGFIKGSPYYFHITFDVFETVGPLGRLIPATRATPTPVPTAAPK